MTKTDTEWLPGAELPPVLVFLGLLVPEMLGT
jgi:hypothetical protein